MASPFAVFRKHQKVLLAVLALLAMIAFVFLSGPVFDALTTGPGHNPVVVRTRAYGNLTEADLAHLLRQQNLVRTFFERVYWTLGFRLPVEPPSEESAVETWLLANRARELGLVVSNQMINTYLQEMTGRRVSRDTFRQVLREMHVSERQLFEAFRTELAARQMLEMIDFSTTPTTPAQRWDYYQRLNRRATVELVAEPVAKYIDRIPDPEEATLREFFEKYKEKYSDPISPEPGFRRPHRVAVEYLKAEIAQFIAPASITEEQIRDYYEKHKDTYYVRSKLPPAEKAGPKSDLPEAPEPKASAESKPQTTVPEAPTPKEPGPEGPKPSEKATPAPPTEAKPVQSKPDQPTPAEAAPVQLKPADTQPAQSKPGDEQTSLLKPADTQPAKPKPVDSPPAQPKPADDQGTKPQPADQPAQQEASKDKPPTPPSPAENPSAQPEPKEKPSEAQAPKEKPSGPAVSQEKPSEFQTPKEKFSAGQTEVITPAFAWTALGGRADRWDEPEPALWTVSAEGQAEASSASEATPSAKPSEATSATAGKSKAPSAPEAKEVPSASGPAPQPTEKPAAEKDEKPAAAGKEASTSAMPSEGTPTDEPLESKPGQPEPKTASPSEAKPAEKPSEGQPAGPSGAGESAAPAPASKYVPLEEVREEIREVLARGQAQAKIEQMLQKLRDQMNSYSQARLASIAAGKQPPALLDLQALAKQYGLQYQKTPLVSEWQLRRDFRDIAHAQVAGRESVLRILYYQGRPPLQPMLAQDLDAYYLFWKLEDAKEAIPSWDYAEAERLEKEAEKARQAGQEEEAAKLAQQAQRARKETDQLRQEVLRAWKMIQARSLARDRAAQLAALARKTGQPLQEALAKEPGVTVLEAGPFTWLTHGGISPRLFVQAPPPRISSIPQVELPGEEFMQTVFRMEPGQVEVAFNQPQTVAYVIRVKTFEPSDEVLWKMFLAEPYSDYSTAAMLDQQKIRRAWLEDLKRQIGFQWERKPHPGAER